MSRKVSIVSCDELRLERILPKSYGNLKDRLRECPSYSIVGVVEIVATP